MKRIHFLSIVLALALAALWWLPEDAVAQACRNLTVGNNTGTPIRELYIVEGYKEHLYEDEGHWGFLAQGNRLRYGPLRDGVDHCKWKVFVLWQGYEDSYGYVECTNRQKIDLNQCNDIWLQWNQNAGCYWTCNR